MDELELLTEVIAFLKDNNQYNNFLDYMNNRGFDSEEVELDVKNLTDY